MFQVTQTGYWSRYSGGVSDSLLKSFCVAPVPGVLDKVKTVEDCAKSITSVVDKLQGLTRALERDGLKAGDSAVAALKSLQDAARATFAGNESLLATAAQAMILTELLKQAQAEAKAMSAAADIAVFQAYWNAFGLFGGVLAERAAHLAAVDMAQVWTAKLSVAITKLKVMTEAISQSIAALNPSPAKDLPQMPAPSTAPLPSSASTTPVPTASEPAGRGRQPEKSGSASSGGGSAPASGGGSAPASGGGSVPAAPTQPSPSSAIGNAGLNAEQQSVGQAVLRAMGSEASPAAAAAQQSVGEAVLNAIRPEAQAPAAPAQPSVGQAVLAALRPETPATPAPGAGPALPVANLPGVTPPFQAPAPAAAPPVLPAGGPPAVPVSAPNLGAASALGTPMATTLPTFPEITPYGQTDQSATAPMGTGSFGGESLDPRRGLGLNEQTGKIVDMSTGQPVDYNAGGRPLDPETRLPFNPQTGELLNPQTGQPLTLDPQTNLPIDPRSGNVINPETGGVVRDAQATGNQQPVGQEVPKDGAHWGHDHEGNKDGGHRGHDHDGNKDGAHWGHDHDGNKDGDRHGHDHDGNKDGDRHGHDHDGGGRGSAGVSTGGHDHNGRHEGHGHEHLRPADRLEVRDAPTDDQSIVRVDGRPSGEPRPDRLDRDIQRV